MEQEKKYKWSKIYGKVRKVMGKTYAQNIFLLLLALFIYNESINYGYNIDDGYYVDILPEEGGVVPEAATKWFNESEFRPATALVLSIEQHLYGRSADVFHLFNILYFTLLCWLILRTFRKLEVFGDKKILLLFTVLFLVHPIHANVVASIKNREVILALMAGLQGSYILYLGFTNDKKRIFLLYSVIGTALIVLASLFKTDGMITLSILPALLIYKRKMDRRLFKRLAFIIAVMILVFLFKGTALENKEGRGEITDVEFFENSMTDVKLTNSFPFLAKGFLKYVEFHVIPTGYHFYFGYRIFDKTTFGDPKALLGALIYLFGAGMLFYRWRRKEPTAMELGGWMFFGLLFPYVYLMGHIAGVLAVRYAFYASLGFCVFLAGAFEVFIKNRPKLGWTVAILVCLIFAVAAMDRTSDWKDSETLYSVDMPHLADSYVANRMVSDYHYGLFTVAQTQEEQRYRLEKSLSYIDQSISIYDKDFRTWNKKANILANLAMPDSAYVCYQRAVELEPKNVRAWLDFTVFAEAYGLEKLMEETSRSAVEADPSSPEALQYYTQSLIKQQKYETAVQANLNAAYSGEQSYFPYINLSTVYHAQADTVGMIESFFMAFRNGYEDPALKRSLRNHVLKRNITSLQQQFPEIFQQ